MATKVTMSIGLGFRWTPARRRQGRNRGCSRPETRFARALRCQGCRKGATTAVGVGNKSQFFLGHIAQPRTFGGDGPSYNIGCCSIFIIIAVTTTRGGHHKFTGTPKKLVSSPLMKAKTDKPTQQQLKSGGCWRQCWRWSLLVVNLGKRMMAAARISFRSSFLLECKRCWYGTVFSWEELSRARSDGCYDGCYDLVFLWYIHHACIHATTTHTHPTGSPLKSI